MSYYDGFRFTQVDEFIEACRSGLESEAKSMVEDDPGLHNKQGYEGNTGLMSALVGTRYSICRWLFSLPGLDTNICNKHNITALHRACWHRAPLDIVISLVRLSSWETINMKSHLSGNTPLESAFSMCNTSAAIYLSSIGAECGENRNEDALQYREVTLHTWIDAGCQQEAQYWAVAANDIRYYSQYTGSLN